MENINGFDSIITGKEFIERQVNYPVKINFNNGKYGCEYERAAKEFLDLIKDLYG